ncbi:GNAT family N-acetyltransferase [Streptomyces sp. NBC_00134]|uniref:GNAT family N-acetyltransferase n=1 Tax=Streptomyces sp. NBC_00134 TaxID=2975663 RepID=UPI0032529B37
MPRRETGGIRAHPARRGGLHGASGRGPRRSSERGVGAALVEAVRDVGRSAGCRRLVAGVREFNAAARPFYEAVGLRPMQVRTDQPL